MQYLYGVIPVDGRRRPTLAFGRLGSGDRGDEVQAIPCGDIAAVVSECPPIDYPALSSEEIVWHLAVHQRVTEMVMQQVSTLLPAKFGTLLADKREVLALLRTALADLRAGLEAMAGKIEMEVVATWDPQPVFAEIALEPEIAELKAALAGRPAPEGFAERVALGQRVKAAFDRRKQAVQRQILDALGAAGIADDVQVNLATHDSVVANLACLLPAARDRQAAFEQRVHALDARFGGGLNFRLVGPLPPYSFSTVEVLRLDPDEVEAARRTLGLGPGADLRQIRAAYRRQARQHHPDVARHDPAAAQRFDEIKRAYELLCRCHQAQYRARRPGGVGEAFRCSFDAASVEGALSVSLRCSQQWGEP